MYWGIFEKRHRYCADRITDIQAMCYLQNYDDLVEKYGRNWKAARKHYYTQGYKEKRSYRCEEFPLGSTNTSDLGPIPVRLQGEKEPFTCQGDVHYTRMSTVANHKPQLAETWDKVRNYGFFTIPSNGKDHVVCNSHHLRDRSQFYWKQCFCEIKPIAIPRFCAKQDKTCQLCDGLVI